MVMTTLWQLKEYIARGAFGTVEKEYVAVAYRFAILASNWTLSSR